MLKHVKKSFCLCSLLWRQQDFPIFTGIDIIVNNAAAFVMGKVETVEESDWSKVFQVNVTAAAHMASTSLPHLKQSNSPVIVNIASISSFIAQTAQVPYNASKGTLFIRYKSPLLYNCDPFNYLASEPTLKLNPSFIDQGLPLIMKTHRYSSVNYSKRL